MGLLNEMFITCSLSRIKEQGGKQNSYIKKLLVMELISQGNKRYSIGKIVHNTVTMSCMVTGGDRQCIMHALVESLCGTPETTFPLYFNNKHL